MNRNDRKAALMVFLSVAFILIGALSAFDVRTAGAGPFPQGSTPPPPPFLPGFEPHGPFYHQIHLARSTDGLTWQTDDVVIRNHASVPSLVGWQETLWIYVADPAQNWLMVLRQDGDVWWETRTQIDGFDPTYAVDPDVVILPDGRLRLYFLDIRTLETTPEGLPGLATIRSAVTSDGVHFALEEGARIQSRAPGTDPDVVQAADGSWWLYVLHDAGTIIAHSTDGLTFAEVGESSTGPMSDTVLLDDGTLRRYYARPGAILSEVSADGLTWTADPGVRIEGTVGHPSVTRLADGSWLMAYVVDTTPADLGTGSGNNNPGP
jgi:hypothetical protein